ncbi:hypothetical protein B0A48_13721 [Cryoendolithus antarcticus]|uniref:Uncharacterized protein n=1 Tax=Cryoendolithus antarcticus TaxID=1507870 RepID=A0A1V8SML6_9PEZI|nr:hypothetical protein B0A48_13721 [Cryoendolithus antarcticus]
MAKADGNGSVSRRSTRSSSESIDKLREVRDLDDMQQTNAEDAGAKDSSKQPAVLPDEEESQGNVHEDLLPTSDFDITQDGQHSTRNTQTNVDTGRDHDMSPPATPVPGNQEAQIAAAQPDHGRQPEQVEPRQMPPPAKKASSKSAPAGQPKKRKASPQDQPETHAADGPDQLKKASGTKPAPKDHDKRSDFREPSNSGSDAPAVDDPAEPIEQFDWDDLCARYGKSMDDLTDRENQIWAEFNNLSNMFNAWVTASEQHEIERSSKRLKTQTTLVRHHEGQLEEKRQHYIKVVEAFQSALKLLGPS